MTQQFLSLSEAESYTGKSRSSLRRFVEKITKPDDHADRKFIVPPPDEVQQLHKENHPFSWKISVELLDREIPKQGTTTQPDATPGNDAITLLKQTIDMLQNELSKKNEQISKFQERDRETNFLLKQHNEQLELLTGLSHTNDQDSPEGDQPKAEQKKTLWDRMNRPLFSRK